MPLLKTNRKSIYVLIFYSIFFLGLFSQFPLKQSVPGNLGVPCVMAFARGYLNELSNLVKGTEIGTSCYGSGMGHGFGESSFLACGTLAFFQYFGFEDHIAYYLYMCVCFIASAFAVFLLAKLYLGDHLASAFAGFAFTCSNFMFANIDDQIVIWYFLPALSIYFLKKYIGSSRQAHLYLSSVLGALQIYVNAYVFTFQMIMLAIVLLCNIRKVHFSGRRFFVAVAAFFLIITPFLALYISVMPSIVSPWDYRNIVSATSLKLDELIWALPGNLLYGHFHAPDDCWDERRFHAFLGGILYLLAGIGLFTRTARKSELIMIALVGMLLAIGPQLQIGSLIVPGPLSFLYSLSDVFRFFRVPLRAFFMTSLALSILAGSGLSRLLSFFASKMPGRTAYAVAAAISLFISSRTRHFPWSHSIIGNIIRSPAHIRIFS